MQVWSRLRAIIEHDGRAAMVTVAATRGSTPRDAGARLIVQPDGSFTGTIGGGTLEWRAIAIAQAALAKRQPPKAELRTFVLGPDMGQCCGGQVDLLFEVLDRNDREPVEAFAAREAEAPFTTAAEIRSDGIRRRVIDRPLPAGSAALADGVLCEGFGEERRPVLLFGAGHVGRALVLALAPLPFAVTWIDPRPDAFPAMVPANVALHQADDPVAMLGGAPDGAFILVMSHSHQLDLAVTTAALADPRFPYVGLIGSKTKRVRFERRVSDAGVPAERLDALVCPIGVPGVRSKLPAVIAAATAAQLLAYDEAIRTAELGFAAGPAQIRRGARG